MTDYFSFLAVQRMLFACLIIAMVGWHLLPSKYETTVYTDCRYFGIICFAEAHNG